MRSLSPAALAAFSSGHAVLVNLVRLDFPGGTMALNSSTWDLDYGGITYRGAAGLGTVDAITDQPGQMPGVNLALQQVDPTLLALALDDADQVQGTPITISTAILDNTTYQIVEVETDWVGYADTMKIAEDGEKAAVGVSAESKAVDLLRGQMLTYTDSDQQVLYPGDLAFQYVVDQSDKPVVWPTKQWFYK